MFSSAKKIMKKFLSALFLITITSQAFSQALYNPDNITIIDITFEDNNWNTTLQDFYDNDIGERLMAIVEVNGSEFDSVGVRYRGGSSTYSEDYGKNPLNIKLDHLKNQDYQGFEVLKLNNGAKDPSFVREVGSYEVVRQYMAAPQANYAQVFVNGNYHGLYTNVESVNKNLLAEAFLSNTDNTRFECSPSYNFDYPTPPFGCTEGHGSSLEYLGDGIVCYFDHYEIQSMTGWEDLRDVTNTLANSPQDTRSILDLDRFIWMSALNNWLVNLDSYLGAETQNYYLFKQDNGLFAPIMEDFNESIGRYPWLTPPNDSDLQTSEANLIGLNPFLGESNVQKPLLNVILNDPTWRRMYVAHFRTMLAENIENGALQNRLEDFQDMITVAVTNDPNPLYSSGDFIDNLNISVADFVNGETAYGVANFLGSRYDYLQTFPEFTATQPTIETPQTDPANPLPETDITITASISDANTVFLGYREVLTDAFTRTPMFDDGNNGDGAANDGIFGVTVPIGIGGLQYYIYAENDEAGKFSPQRAELEFHTVGTSSDVVINEVLADNETIQADQDGEFDDWAELYNNTDVSVNLGGWFLTDNETVLNKWTFPNGTFLDANGYLMVWIDDDEEQDGLHTSFKLANGGEALYLVNPQLQIVDQLIFGPQSNDISMARCPNGTGGFEFATPTFDDNNASGCTVGTNDLVLGVDYRVFPNPVSEAIFVETTDFEKRNIQLFNLVGQAVFTGSFSEEIEVSVKELGSGIYFLKIDGAGVQRVVVE
ncbi:MAG: hypothetical protein ACI9XO_004098 [Paraglaciecola sp.]|jgi:hypothetical protein